MKTKLIMKNTAILINSLSSGGAEKVVSILINEFFDQGLPIKLVCFERKIFYKIPEGSYIDFIGSFSGNEHPILKLISIPFLAWKLKKYVKKNNISIVQSHIYRANYVNIFSTIFGSKHVVQIVNHGQVGQYRKEGLLGKINILLIKFLYPKADLVISIAKGMLYDMEKEVMLHSRKMVINNPYNYFEIQCQSTEKIDDFDFKENKIYLITMGRCIKLKSQITIIKCLKYLDSNHELIILGDGPEKVNLINLSKSLSLNERVHFLGIKKNPFKYIKNSDIFILSSTTEGFPNALVEAMICGIPVISTDCVSGPREILAPDTCLKNQLVNTVEYAKYGILFPIENAELLTEAVKTLTNNKNVYQQYRKAGLKRAQDFDVKIIVEKYKNVLGFMEKVNNENNPIS